MNEVREWEDIQFEWMKRDGAGIATRCKWNGNKMVNDWYQGDDGMVAKL